MDEQEKNAYRWLLFQAMLEIRYLQWQLQGPLWRCLNPLKWGDRLHCVRRSASIADSLHNLAMFAANDFEGFDEEFFWKRVGEIKPVNETDFDYRAGFDDRLKELKARNIE